MLKTKLSVRLEMEFSPTAKRIRRLAAAVFQIALALALMR